MTKRSRTTPLNKKSTNDPRSHTSGICTLEELERIRASVQAQPFDPISLLQEAREQWSPVPRMAEAFARCTQEWPESEWYTHFLAPAERKDWAFAGTVPLAHPEWGTLMVDVLHHPTEMRRYAIGGIEYLDRVLGHHLPIGEFFAMLEGACAAFEKRKCA